MSYLRPAQQRGNTNLGWLNSYHSFSFGHYYAPKHRGLSVLRVLNDDTVAGGAGFDTHGHKDMEIISYVLSGTIKHKDSLGNTFLIPAGDIQRMSAGQGILHSEYNASAHEPLHFLQIWIHTKYLGLQPDYEQKHIKQTKPLSPLVTPGGEAGSLRINQDVSIYRLRLLKNEYHTLRLKQDDAYLHIIDGSATLAGHTLSKADGLGLQQDDDLVIKAGKQGVEALWFDLPGQGN